MDYESIVRIVLLNGIETCAGLWEAVWDLNTQFPDGANGLNKAAIMGVMGDLLAKGWVQMFRATSECMDREGPEPLGLKESLGIVRNPSLLSPPSEIEIWYRFSTTETGVEAYSQGNF